MKKVLRGFASHIFIAVSALLLIGIGAYIYAYPDQVPWFTPLTNSSASDWKTYANTEQGVSFRYPSSWYLEESDDRSFARFSKSKIVNGSADTTRRSFGIFYVNDLVLPNNTKVSPQEYIAYYDQAPESGEWEIINDIPVWFYKILGEEEYRYEVFTSQKIYSFVLYGNTAERPTDLTAEDFEVLERVISTLSVTFKPSEAFVNLLSDKTSSLAILIPNGGVLSLGKATTITWIPGGAPVPLDSVSLILMTPDMKDEAQCPEDGPNSVNRAHDCRQYLLFSDIPNNGSVQWEVGKTADGHSIPPGNYFIKIYQGHVGPEEEDTLEKEGFSVEYYSQLFTLAAP